MCLSFFTPRLCLDKLLDKTVDRLKTKDKNNYPKTNVVTIFAQISKIIEDCKQLGSIKAITPELF